MRWTKWIKY